MCKTHFKTFHTLPFKNFENFQRYFVFFWLKVLQKYKRSKFEDWESKQNVADQAIKIGKSESTPIFFRP